MDEDIRKELKGILPKEHQMNLSDFALFLSVMKNKRAYECTLSIILGEPGLELEEVKVEQVVLNKAGKRAIRLDAWARDKEGRWFDMEMQNDSSGDDIPRRCRFYQSLMDAPALKSGKETKYRELPESVIIFITQADIWGKGLAKYEFTQQCEGAPGLRLEDGTAKIFLNMEGKSGSQELVSLLQYMKDTRLRNTGVRDARIIELDKIVKEVKESEEWEAVQMNIMEIAMERGLERGLEQGLVQGLEQGRERINMLNKRLLSENRMDDLRRSIEDEEYQRKLFAEYQI